MMAMWQFFDYITDGGRAPVEDWLVNHLLPAEQAEFEVAIDYLQRIEDWDSVKKASRKYRELVRELQGLTELKFSVTVQIMGRNLKKHFRPLGILKRDQRQFIFLGGFQKGNPNPIPVDAFTDALRYKREYEQDRGDIREHKT
jgi:hypothetical protein